MREEFRNLLPQLETDFEDLRRMRDEALEEATKGDNPLLAEAAREVQQGRMTMLEAVSSPAYRDEFEKAVNAFVQTVQEMAPDEAEQEAEPSEKAVADHEDSDDEDDAFPESLLIDAAPSRENISRHREC